MNRYFYRGIIDDLNIRFVLFRDDTLNEQIIKIHNLTPISGLLLLKAINSSLLCSSLLSKDEKYSFQWRYPGIAKLCTVEVDSCNNVRGFISASNIIEKTQQEILGDIGNIALIKYQKNQIISSSQSKAPLLDYCDDLSFFFSTSHQIETHIKSLVAFSSKNKNFVQNSSSFLFQAMPQCNLELFDKIRTYTLSLEFDEFMTQDNSVEEIFENIFEKCNLHNTKYSKYACVNANYQCNCSRDRMLMIVKSLGKKEVESILNDEQKIAINCHFCSQNYVFYEQDLI